MKMHGLGLTVLLDTPTRRFVSNQSYDKPLEYVKETTRNMPKMLWLRYELISRPEKIMIGLFKRYVELVNSNKISQVDNKTQLSNSQINPENESILDRRLSSPTFKELKL
jgi:hypothetical protein